MYLFPCDSVAVSAGVIFINQSVRNGYVSTDNAASPGWDPSPKVLNFTIQSLEEITSLLEQVSQQFTVPLLEELTEISHWLLWMSVDTNINLLETFAVTPGILLHPEYPNSLAWTTVQNNNCVLLTLFSNKKFPLKKHCGKTLGNICVHCPRICAHMGAEVSLLSTWRPFNKIARTAKCGQNKESPLGTAWDLFLSQDQPQQLREESKEKFMSLWSCD